MRLRGIVKGQTLVLDQPLDLLEGLSVEVEVTPCNIEAKERLARRELLARYGIKPTPSRGSVVTSETVNRIRDELGF